MRGMDGNFSGQPNALALRGCKKEGRDERKEYTHSFGPSGQILCEGERAVGEMVARHRRSKGERGGGKREKLDRTGFDPLSSGRG